MVSGLEIKVLFALSYHLFYQSLAGTTTPSATYSIQGHSIPRQEINTSFGTAFAFLVN